MQLTSKSDGREHTRKFNIVLSSSQFPLSSEEDLRTLDVPSKKIREKFKGQQNLLDYLFASQMAMLTRLMDDRPEMSTRFILS
ncbi:unnamed protein product [Schistosoma margrebowiei]|uniref:Uncharacterized protein n=1 Tax=Schistosoma margrebowiei TaxID=48269 RepID=A0A183MJ51_9TREM|nr:unnamed protein product [Schistosoma margrebowiei]